MSEGKLPKIKTKIVNESQTKEILEYYIKEKKVIINYLEEKLKKEKKKLQILESDLRRVKYF